jgi:hypothetical protein
MAALSDRKTEIVRTLVETAPDKVVGGLQRALAETGGDTALARIKELVDGEARDRVLRNAIFQPVAPLCVGDGSDKRRLVFPASALSLLWRGLKVYAPGPVEAATTAAAAMAKAIANEQRPPDPTKAFDAVIAAAAEGLRSSEVRDLRSAAELCDRARPGGADAFIACLQIAPVVRLTLPRLAEWLAQPGEDTAAAARLAYKDAVAIAEDAGPRFFEMLAAQLTPPWMVLRIISAIMDKPTERYLADSELGGFPERVMGEIDEALTSISKLDLDAGAAAGREAGRKIGLIATQTMEIEACINLSRKHGWGRRIVSQRQAMAGLVEGCLRETERLAEAALPTEEAGRKRMHRRLPRLTVAPEPQAVVRAMTLLTFTQEIRTSANYAGFCAVHAKTLETIGGMLDHYVEDVLDHIKTGDAPDIGVAEAFLGVAADFCELIRDDRTAALVRRRARTACHGEGSPGADGQAG